MPSTESIPGRSRPGRPKGWRKGAQHSKGFIQRAKDARALKSSIEVFGAQVTEGLGKRLTPELADGETLPDFSFSLELFGRSVGSALERLRRAELEYLNQSSRCVTVRRQSEKLARQEVYPRVVSVRRLIEAQFGKEEGRAIHGMAGKTRRKARRLHGQLGHLVWVLEEGSIELPAPLMRTAPATREEWLRDIKPGYEQLSELLDELTGLEVAEQSAKIDKDQAMQAFDEAYGEARRLVEAHFAFAGLDNRWSRWLRSNQHRRELIREARRKREVRAEGRLKQTLRSAAESLKSWIRRPNAAA